MGWSIDSDGALGYEQFAQTFQQAAGRRRPRGSASSRAAGREFVLFHPKGGKRCTRGAGSPDALDISTAGDDVTIRMDNVLIVVEDIEAAKAFFTELGMEVEGETQVEGPWVGSTVGLKDVHADITMMRTPDGHGRVELSRFHSPPAVRAEPESAPANALGIRRIMFAVDDIDDVVARLRGHGGELVGEIAQYGDIYRLCFLRGPEGIIIGLSERLG
jgi:catechol 2,3-dioxygenase-like lactoylglutathione lyase family enzyme